jgi:hypothetical protein
MKAFDSLHIRRYFSATHQGKDLLCRIKDSFDSGQWITGSSNPRYFLQISLVNNSSRADFNYGPDLMSGAVFGSTGTVGDVTNRDLIGLNGHMWAAVRHYPFTAYGAYSLCCEACRLAKAQM